MNYIYSAVLAVGLLGCLPPSGSVRYPIGAIIDYASKQTITALNYSLKRRGGRPITDTDTQGDVRLDANVQKIQINDAFSVTSTICSQMSNGIFMLFGEHSVSTINAIKSFTSHFHMPFVTPSMAIHTPGQKVGYELYMRPLYNHALLDIIRHYRWQKVYYVYDSDEGLWRLQQLFDAVAEMEVVLEIDVYRVRDSDEAYKTLNALDQSEGASKHIVLDMPTLQVKQLIEKMIVKFHYLLVGLDINELNLKSFEHGGVNLTGFRLVDFQNTEAKKILADWPDIDEEKEIPFAAALTIDSVHLMMKSIAALQQRNPRIFNDVFKPGGRFMNNGTEGIDCDSDPIIPWKYGYDLMKTMRETAFKGLTGWIAFDENGLRKQYTLEILDVHLNRGLAKIGSWTREDGMEIQNPSMVRSDKGNNVIANKTRIVTSILTEPYLMLRVTPKGGVPLTGNDKYHGYCADVAAKISDIVGFEYIIEPVKDGKYGGEDENGTWNGMVGELIRQEADLAIAPLTITMVRDSMIDFSKPFMSLGISIMIKKMNKEVPGVFSFMYPLSYEIWMCVIFAYIGVSVVLFLVSRFSPFEWHIEDNTEGPTVTNNFTIFNSLWFSLGAFMQQGCDIEPRSMSGRVVGSVWWFFTLIIISSYTANLAAFLTAQRMQSPIESADDLAKQTEIKYGTVESGSTKQFFKKSSIAIYERMWAFMSSAEPSVWVGSNEDGVNRVRKEKGRYAFLMESATNAYINQRKPCDTMQVGGNLDSKGYGVGTPLGSDLRDRVTLAVLELREKGELQKLEKKWWYEKGECGADTSNVKQDATSALKLDNVAGIFYILVGGLVLSLVMAVLEFLYKSKAEARRRKTSFANALRSKARLSIKGEPEQHTTAVGDLDLPANMSMSTYTYAPAAQLISLDGYADGNTHTQV